MTLTEFRTVYPEFAQVPDAVIQRYLDEFTVFYQADYGDYTDTLQGLYVAHWVTATYNLTTGLPKPGGVSMSITSRTVGDVSMSGTLIGVGSDSTFWDSTIWGQKFQMYIGLFGAGPSLTGRNYGYGYGQ